MAEHVGPLRFQLRPMRSLRNRFQGRDLDALDPSLLLQNLLDEARVEPQVVSPEEVDDVVEITGSAALPHGPKLLGEDLLEGVAAHRAVARKLVRVRMGDHSQLRGADHPLLGAEVELDTRRLSRLPRPAIVDSTLSGGLGGTEAKTWRLKREVQARLLAHAGQNPLQVRQKVVRSKWAAGQDREIQVL